MKFCEGWGGVGMLEAGATSRKPIYRWTNVTLTMILFLLNMQFALVLP